MSIDLSLAVDALSFDTITRRRIAAGSYVAGTYVPGAETSTTLAASITPLPDRELERATDGQRTRGGWRLITTEDLRTADRAGSTPADRVVFRGRVHEVVRVGDWTAYGFRDVLVAEVEP